MVTIREESLHDRAAIREVNRLAFTGEDEARLVDRLRSDGEVTASLVALDQVEGGEERVVGHILFSRLPIETETEVILAVALAPMAVLPGRQRQGIGSALVWEGLERCRKRGYSIAVVLGHPVYYPRFGFSARLTKNFIAPFTGDAFMALELIPGALEGVSGTVRYPAAFGLMEQDGSNH